MCCLGPLAWYIKEKVDRVNKNLKKHEKQVILLKRAMKPNGLFGTIKFIKLAGMTYNLSHTENEPKNNNFNNKNNIC